EVTLISGPSSLTPPKNIKFISVNTSSDMLDAVEKEIGSSTVFVMSAAVSDYKPEKPSRRKIEKTGDLVLRLKRSHDIVKEIGRRENRPFIIGFAAETGKNIERVKTKLREKNMDMIVFNDVTEDGSGFDVDTNKVIIIDKYGQVNLPLMSKDSVADAILDKMVEIRA
ncbi:MAG: phosphopantothenoylcysteine decarboxylase, partial [Nitrospirota bacterium]